MSLVNSTVFNTNPVCNGYVVTDVVTDPYKTTQLVVFVLVAFLITVTSLFFIWRRMHRRRLQNKSLVPIVWGSLLGAVFILIRAYYNYVGKEYFPCQFHIFLFYMAIPIMQGADFVEIVGYLDRLSIRQTANAITISAVNQLQQKTSIDQLGRASLKTYFIGIFNQCLLLLDLFTFQANFFVKKFALHGDTRFRSVSKMRRAAYDTTILFILAMPNLIAFLVRLYTVPPYTQCTGCGLFWEDWLIILFLVFMYVPPSINFLYIHRDLPDALSMRQEYVRANLAAMPVGFAFSLLYFLDPDRIMQRQVFDWFTGESIGILMFHYFRCIRALQLTARRKRWGETHVTLMDVLNDPAAALLLEKYLISELANENLIFWREATQYKKGFGTRDFDMSQELARVLYRSFIGPHAHLPINISDDLADGIKQGCRGVIGRTVFDAALVQVYELLSNGPFRRFIKTSEFQEFLKTRADFGFGDDMAVSATNVELYVRML